MRSRRSSSKAERVGGKVWFARLRAGGLDITGGDVRAYEEARRFSMVVGVETTDEADRVFTGLADGASRVAKSWPPDLARPAPSQATEQAQLPNRTLSR